MIRKLYSRQEEESFVTENRWKNIDRGTAGGGDQILKSWCMVVEVGPTE